MILPLPPDYTKDETKKPLIFKSAGEKNFQAAYGLFHIRGDSGGSFGLK